MLHIEKITLRLPAEYEGRAESIAGLIGERLSDMKMPGINSRIDCMTIGPLTVPAGGSDADVAAMVGENIIRQVEKKI